MYAYAEYMKRTDNEIDIVKWTQRSDCVERK